MRKLLLPVIALALVLSACSDNLTSLNENPKGPAEVPGETLFSNAQVSLGTYLNSTDVNSNIFKLMSQYWAQNTYATESQYELTTRAIPSNLWEELYTNVLKDLDDAEAKISNDQFLDESVKQNQLATIEILKVMTYYELVTIFGDIPYSEALDPQNTQPNYEDAEVVYEDLMTRLNSALQNLDTEVAAFGSADVYYQGDVEQWVKFANALKMRLAITVADVNPSVAQTAIEEAAGNTFESNADNATIPFQSSPPHTNPLWEALVQSGRHDYVPANTLIDEMNSLNDPRREAQFTLAPDTTVYIGGTYGTTNDYDSNSHFSEMTKSPTFEGMLIEYAEVQFILAEAEARGWDVTPGTAATHYREAITADMEYWGVPNNEIQQYLQQNSVNYATAPGTWKEKIGKQKWLGLYLQGLQGWTEWRRLDAPTLNIPPVDGVNSIPTRFTYPVDEQNLNQSNYEQAASEMGGDNLDTQLFWDIN